MSFRTHREPEKNRETATFFRPEIKDGWTTWPIRIGPFTPAPDSERTGPAHLVLKFSPTLSQPPKIYDLCDKLTTDITGCRCYIVRVELVRFSRSNITLPAQTPGGPPSSTRQLVGYNPSPLHARARDESRHASSNTLFRRKRDDANPRKDAVGTMDAVRRWKHVRARTYASVQRAPHASLHHRDFTSSPGDRCRGNRYHARN